MTVRFLFWINAALIFACLNVGLLGKVALGSGLLALYGCIALCERDLARMGQFSILQLITGLRDGCPAFYITTAVLGYTHLLRSGRVSIMTALVVLLLGISYPLWSALYQHDAYASVTNSPEAPEAGCRTARGSGPTSAAFIVGHGTPASESAVSIFSSYPATLETKQSKKDRRSSSDATVISKVWGAAVEREKIYDFMKRQRYGVVSSVAADGTPQSALVGIATTSEMEVVFDTSKSSRKYRNLLRNPRCSFVLGWTGEQTVQLEGIAEEPVGGELRRLQRAYFQAWPDGPARMSWPDIAYVVVHPRWLRYSDYDQVPPLVWEAKYEETA